MQREMETDHTIQFSNCCDIYKVAKVVHGNWTNSHRNRLPILLLLLLLLPHTHTHTHMHACTHACTHAHTCSLSLWPDITAMVDWT